MSKNYTAHTRKPTPGESCTQLTLQEVIHHTRVIIRCDDTDVLVLLLHYYSKGHLNGEVYMHAGHSGKMTMNERYIPVHQLAHKIGQKV